MKSFIFLTIILSLSSCTKNNRTKKIKSTIVSTQAGDGNPSKDNEVQNISTKEDIKEKQDHNDGLDQIEGLDNSTQSPTEDRNSSSNKDDILPETQTETKSETQAETKPETQAETKPEIQAEAKPETQAETKPETQAEAKPETQAEAKAETQAEAKPETQAETKPGTEIKEEIKTELDETLIVEESDENELRACSKEEDQLVIEADRISSIFFNNVNSVLDTRDLVKFSTNQSKEALSPLVEELKKSMKALSGNKKIELNLEKSGAKERNTYWERISNDDKIEANFKDHAENCKSLESKISNQGNCTSSVNEYMPTLQSSFDYFCSLNSEQYDSYYSSDVINKLNSAIEISKKITRRCETQVKNLIELIEDAKVDLKESRENTTKLDEDSETYTNDVQALREKGDESLSEIENSCQELKDLKPNCYIKDQMIDLNKVQSLCSN